MKIDIEYSEKFEDDMIKLYDANKERHLPVYYREQLFDELEIIYPENLKYSKYVPELEKEYSALYMRIFNFKNSVYNISELENEYLELTTKIKKYKINYDSENIKWLSEKLKLRYNYLFKSYQFWLLDQIVLKMKEEKPEWKNILEMFKY